MRSYPDLKTWRRAQRYTQEEAAAYLGISQTFYSRLERGIFWPGRATAKRLMERTGVALETLLGVA